MTLPCSTTKTGETWDEQLLGLQQLIEVVSPLQSESTLIQNIPYEQLITYESRQYNNWSMSLDRQIWLC